MNGRHPDLDRIKRCIHDLPAALEGPEPRRLEAILHRVIQPSPTQRPRVRYRHAFWWIILALTTGMATAAIWYQTRKVLNEPAIVVKSSGDTYRQQHDMNQSQSESGMDTESPQSRPDRRFIPQQ